MTEFPSFKFVSDADLKDASHKLEVEWQAQKVQIATAEARQRISTHLSTHSGKVEVATTTN